MRSGSVFSASPSLSLLLPPSLSQRLDRATGSVGKQVVNVPSFVVRVDSQKHIDFSLTSPLGGGRAGRTKRKNMRKGDGEEEGADEE